MYILGKPHTNFQLKAVLDGYIHVCDPQVQC